MAPVAGMGVKLSEKPTVTEGIFVGMARVVGGKDVFLRCHEVVDWKVADKVIDILKVVVKGLPSRTRSLAKLSDGQLGELPLFAEVEKGLAVELLGAIGLFQHEPSWT